MLSQGGAEFHPQLLYFRGAFWRLGGGGAAGLELDGECSIRIILA
jgi:hypothetical protein